MALVQNSGTVHGSGVTSVQYTWPTAPKIGNKIILTFVGYSSPVGPIPTVTDDAGNTYTSRAAIANPGSQARSTIFEATVASVPTKTTVALSATVDYAGTFSEWSNVGAFDTQATGNSDGSPASVGPTATLAQADELVISVFGGALGGTAVGIAVPSGFTALGLEQNSSAYIGMGSAYRVVSSTAPITAAWTFTSGTANGRALATFRLSAVASATAAQTLGGVSQTAASVVAAKAAANQTAAGVTQAAAAAVITKASAAQTTVEVSQSAVAVVTNSASATAVQTLSGVGQAAAGAALVAASATQTLGAVSQSATAVTQATAHISATQDLGGVAQAATVASVARASGTQVLDAVANEARASVTAAARASQMLGDVSQDARLTAVEAVSQFIAAQMLAGVLQSARLDHQYGFERNERTLLVAGERRGFGIAPEVRSAAVAPESRTVALVGERRRIAFTD